MEIFQPRLQLIAEPDGELTLHAVTLTPSTGYSAGRAHPGVPPKPAGTTYQGVLVREPDSDAVHLDVDVVQ